MLCPFNGHLFIKRYFIYIYIYIYISNMKGYVLSIDTFSYIYIYMELEFSQRKFQYLNFPLYSFYK